LSELIAVSVNEPFHFSIPSNAAGEPDEPCPTEGREARRSTQAKRIRSTIGRNLSKDYNRDVCGAFTLMKNVSMSLRRCIAIRMPNKNAEVPIPAGDE
jgi:hypothetical protein